MGNLRQRLARLEKARAKRRKGRGEIALIVGQRDSAGNLDPEAARKVAEAERDGVSVILLTGNIDPSRL